MKDLLRIDMKKLSVAEVICDREEFEEPSSEALKYFFKPSA